MKLHLSLKVATNTTLVELLASHSELSKSSIKKALNFGGGWIKLQGKGSLQRCRRATKEVCKGDVVEFYYDDRLYSQNQPNPVLVHTNRHWSIWYKPTNLVAQGTPYGDIGSMEYQVSQQNGKREVHLIHRLDREAAGLMIFGHHRLAAAKLSHVWQQGQVEKIYQAEVHGKLPAPWGTLNSPLDGKESITHFRVYAPADAASQDRDTSFVTINLQTGRFHQIRRHFADFGHPLVGDPRYTDPEAQYHSNRPLQLVATELNFTCPIESKRHEIRLPQEFRLF